MIGDLVGIPYETHGRSDQGVDCLGLVIMFYQRQGIEFPDYLGLYQDTRQFEQIDKHINENKSRLSQVAEPCFGDVVLMRIGKFACHLGIFIDDCTFLHAHEGRESSIDRLDSYAWKHRVIGYFRARDIQR